MAELVETAGRALVLLTMVLGAAAASYRFGRHLVGSTPVLFRLMTTALVGCFLATAGFFLLLPLGLFRWWAGWAACLCVGFVALGWPATGSSLKRQLAQDSRALRRLARSKLPGRWRGIALWFALFAAVIMARCLIVPPLGWDTLTYHGPRAILWVQTGQFTFEEAPGSWELYRHFLSGVEVLVAWAMLPMHSDLLAGAAGGAQWLALGVAVAALSRELGLRGPDALTVVVGAMFIPVIQLLAGSGYSEPGLYFFATSGIAAAIRFQKVPSWPPLLIAGAALGLAAGAKPQGPAYAAVTALFVLIVIAKTNTSRTGAVAMSAAFLGLAALPVLPWMIASYWDTGYPFAPFPMEIGGWVLGEGSVAMRWLQMRPAVVPYSDQEWGAISKVFETPGQFPETVGLLYLVPLALLPAGAIAGLRRGPWPVMLLLTVIATVIAIHFSPAMSLVRIDWAYSSSRQVAFAVILALPIVMMAGRAAPRFGAFCRAITVGTAGYYAFGYSRFGWAGFEYVDIAVVLAAIGSGAWLVWKVRQRSARLAFSVALLAAIVGLCVLNWRTSTTRLWAIGQSQHVHAVPRYWRDALPGDEAGPFTLAVTAGPKQAANNWFTYFFFGRRFQHRLIYVPPTRSGRVVHFGPNQPLQSAGDQQAWTERLHAQGVHAVLSFLPRSMESLWMDQSPEQFKKLAGGEEWGLYAVVRDR